MARINYLQNNFTSGQLSPLLFGQKRFDKFQNGLEIQKNLISMPLGGITRKPGSQVLNNTKNTDSVIRYPRFQFSVFDSLILEMGEYYFRFLTPQGYVLNGAAPYELAHPYSSSQIAAVQTIQSNDQMFFFHPQVPTQLLSRFGPTNWQLAPATFTQGPFAPENITSTTITANNATGSIALTASAPAFKANDVGRQITLTSGTTTGFGVITSFVSATQATAQVSQAMPTNATTYWSLGAFGLDELYPGSGYFVEDRLGLAGQKANADTINLSSTGDYYNFALGNNDNNAMQLTLLARDYNRVQWIYFNQVLILGTNNGLWSVSSSNFRDLALTPTNVRAKQEVQYGVDASPPVTLGRSTIFLQFGRKKLRELTFSLELDGFDTPELTLLAENITGAGVSQLCTQRSPFDMVWMVRDDGVLLCLTYLKEQGVCAFAEMHMGGVDARVEAIQTLQTGETEQLFMCVSRLLNGVRVRTNEIMHPLYDERLPEFAHFVDCGKFYDGRQAATLNQARIPGTNNVTLTTDKPVFMPSHISADVVALDSSLKATRGRATITAFIDSQTVTASIQNTFATPSSAPMTWGIALKTVTGLSYLEQGQVVVRGDGAELGEFVVNQGTLTLASPAVFISVGFEAPYNGATLPWDVGSSLGSSEGQLQRIHEVAVRVHETEDFQLSVTEKPQQVLTRYPAVPLGDAPPPFTGVRTIKTGGGWVRSPRISFGGRGTGPFTLLTLMAKIGVSDA